MEAQWYLKHLGHAEAVVGSETGELDGAYTVEDLDARMQGLDFGGGSKWFKARESLWAAGRCDLTYMLESSL